MGINPYKYEYGADEDQKNAANNRAIKWLRSFEDHIEDMLTQAEMLTRHLLNAKETVADLEYGFPSGLEVTRELIKTRASIIESVERLKKNIKERGGEIDAEEVPF